MIFCPGFTSIKLPRAGIFTGNIHRSNFPRADIEDYACRLNFYETQSRDIPLKPISVIGIN